MPLGALKVLGPCLSTELAEYLVQTAGLSPAAARQRIARAAAPVKKLAHLPFARGVRFVYLEKDFRSPYYWQRLFAAILASKSAYARALVAVQARSIVPVAHFTAACGAPIAQKKHISAGAVLERMVAAGVFERREVPGIGECVMTRQLSEYMDAMPPEAVAQVRARLIAEGILLGSVNEWLRRLSIASFNKVKIRGGAAEMPMLGTFAWDLTAPSYLGPLSVQDKDGSMRPGLIACDVLLAGSLGFGSAETFLYKVRALRALKKLGKTLFIYVSEHYSKEAFQELRSAGILPATPETLFGKDVADGFKELSKVLAEAAIRSVSPEKFDMLFNSLGKLEGAAGNMRGAFFELLVAEVVRRDRSPAIELNKICKGKDGAKAEVDVWLVIPNREAYFIECKGHAPGSSIDDTEIDQWLTKRILTVRHYVDQYLDRKPTRLIFELWYTGTLSDESLSRVERTRDANRKQFELVLVGPEEIRAKVRELNDPSLLRTFEQHFLPLQHVAVSRARRLQD
ncbi:hypothetical protein NX773_22635 [Massilia solisilvae]|uniref:NERD domain-containing protein n=1 Tax=Massilia solisilvae TaxID=1811225 RepID=A0ABT2BR21_9BURK|nr:hypothetical protein [Massilia solisilvae]MCS0610964.1 hypothetical protein [Massilia solisilvae]